MCYADMNVLCIHIYIYLCMYVSLYKNHPQSSIKEVKHQKWLSFALKKHSVMQNADYTR